MSDSQIRALGRWKSDAFPKYIKNALIIHIVISVKASSGILRGEVAAFCPSYSGLIIDLQGQQFSSVQNYVVVLF